MFSLAPVHTTEDAKSSAVPGAGPQPDISRRLLFSVLLTAAFAAVAFFGLLHHEMWRNEIQAWLIARDSTSLIDLCKNLKYENHPCLWYLCLIPLTRIFADPFAMGIMHISIASCAVFVFARFAPFTNLQKILFAFGYYSLFEYGIISRGYELGNLFLFTFCALYAMPRRNYLLLFGALSLLANTSICGTIIALALAGALLFCRVTKYDTAAQGKYMLPAILLFCSALVLAVAQMMPASDGFHGYSLHSDPGFRAIFGRALFAAVGTAMGYLPIPCDGLYFYGSSIFGQSKVLYWLACICAVSFTAAFAYGLRKHTPFLIAYLLGMVGLVGFSAVFSFGYVWHFGQQFMLLIACLWLAGQALGQGKNGFLTALLAVQSLVGAYAYAMDFSYPFSQCREAANYIQKDPQLSKLPIAGFPDFAMSPLCAWLKRPMYFLQSESMGTYVAWNGKRKHALEVDREAALLNFAKRTGSFLLVQSGPCTMHSKVLTVTPISSFTGSIVSAEDCYLYLIEKN